MHPNDEGWLGNLQLGRADVAPQPRCGVPDMIQVTRSVYEKLKNEFVFEARGTIEVKGKGNVEAWLLKL